MPHNEQSVDVAVLRTSDMADSCLQADLQAMPFVWKFSFCVEPSELKARTVPQPTATADPDLSLVITLPTSSDVDG
jgi:hypothetical protein